MAFVKCPRCGKTISDKSERCPSCGTKIEELFNKEGSKVEAIIEDDVAETIDVENTVTGYVEDKEYEDVDKNDQVQSVISDDSGKRIVVNDDLLLKDKSKSDRYIKIVVTVTACIIVLLLVIKFIFFNDNNLDLITSEISSDFFKNENVSNVNISGNSDNYIIGEWEMTGVTTNGDNVFTPDRLEVALGYPVAGKMVVNSKSFSLNLTLENIVNESGKWEIYEKSNDYIAYILSDSLVYLALINYDNADVLLLEPILEDVDAVFVFEKNN